jgi:ssDNA-binding Zn-finger/Zn-ribbon topoisomerase 1
MKPENLKCPECDGPMVSRVTRTEPPRRFWGCRQFPSCKGTRNTDGEPPRRRPFMDLTNDDVTGITAETPSEQLRRRDKRRWDE